MNPFRKIHLWWLKRKLEKLEAEAEAHAAELAEIESNKKTIRGHIKTHVDALTTMGFKCSPEYSTRIDGKYETGNCLVLSPDGKPYTLVVFLAGGSMLRPI